MKTIKIIFLLLLVASISFAQNSELSQDVDNKLLVETITESSQTGIDFFVLESESTLNELTDNFSSFIADISIFIDFVETTPTWDEHFTTVSPFVQNYENLVTAAAKLDFLFNGDFDQLTGDAAAATLAAFECSQDLAGAQSELGLVRSELDNAFIQLSNCQNNLAALQQIIEDDLPDGVQLIALVDSTGDVNVQLLSQIASLNIQLTNLNVAYATLVETSSLCQIANDSMTILIDSQDEQITSLQSRLTESNNEADSLSMLVAIQNQTIDSQDILVAQLQSQLDQANQDITTLLASGDLYTARIDLLTDMLEAADTVDCSGLEQQVQDLQSVNITLLSQLANCGGSDCSSQDAQIAVLTASNQNLTNTNETLQNQLADCLNNQGSDCSAQDAQIASLQNQLNACNDSNGQLISNNSALQEQLDSCLTGGVIDSSIIGTPEVAFVQAFVSGDFAYMYLFANYQLPTGSSVISSSSNIGQYEYLVNRNTTTGLNYSVFRKNISNTPNQIIEGSLFYKGVEYNASLNYDNGNHSTLRSFDTIQIPNTITNTGSILVPYTAIDETNLGIQGGSQNISLGKTTISQGDIYFDINLEIK